MTVEGTPKRVTKLLLSNKSLTGSIPKELGQLSGLDEIRLAGNSLTGCIPIALEDVATNDLSSLNLLYCRPPAPESLSATQTETSITLSWGAVSNTTKYRVEYREALPVDWIVDSETVTTATHTVDELNCGTLYQFRVSAYGNGTTYAASWSEPSAVAPLYLEPSDGPMGTTGACPEFSPTPTASGRTNTISQAVEWAGFAPAAPVAAR